VEKFNETPPPGANPAWWAGFAERCVDKLDPSERVDYLVVDEIQDLLEPHFLRVLDKLVVGGLENGRWLFTGDLENQDLYSRAENLVQLRGVPTRLLLRDNCRNLEPHGRWVQTMTDRPDLYRDFLRRERAESPVVMFVEGSPDEALRNALNSALKSRKPEEVVVLVRDVSRQKQVTARFGLKGLESPVVIFEGSLIDPVELFLTATTRATEDLVVLLPVIEQTEFMRRI
jgi:hypothetical protein